MRKYALLSQVFTAFAKCPPSICAQSEVKSRFSLSATGNGCFSAAFWRATRVDLESAFALGFVEDVGLGGIE